MRGWGKGFLFLTLSLSHGTFPSSPSTVLVPSLPLLTWLALETPIPLTPTPKVRGWGDTLALLSLLLLGRALWAGTW